MRRLMVMIVFGIVSLYSNSFANENLQVIQDTANEGKHLFMFFYKDKNEKTLRLQNVFEQTIQKMGRQAKSIKVNVNEPQKKNLVERFNLERSPMPFVVVLAPNGAIMGGFSSFTEEQLMDSISSVGAAACLKCLQDRKLVLLCLQNGQTLNNEAALAGVNAFKADPRFGNATEIVMIDPSDEKEHKFLNQLGINRDSKESKVVLIAPPAEIVGTYQGPVSKGQLISDLEKAASGCCAGGCPGGKCGN